MAENTAVQLGPTGWQGGQMNTDMTNAVARTAQRGHEVVMSNLDKQKEAMRLSNQKELQANALKDAERDRVFQNDLALNRQDFEMRFQSHLENREDYLFNRNTDLIQQENEKRQKDLEEYNKHQMAVDQMEAKMYLEIMRAYQSDKAKSTELYIKQQRSQENYNMQRAKITEAQTMMATGLEEELKRIPAVSDTVQNSLTMNALPEGHPGRTSTSGQDMAQYQLNRYTAAGDKILSNATGGRLTMTTLIKSTPEQLEEKVRNGEITPVNVAMGMGMVNMMRTKLAAEIQPSGSDPKALITGSANQYADAKLQTALITLTKLGMSKDPSVSQPIKEAVDAATGRGAQPILEALQKEFGTGPNALSAASGVVQQSIDEWARANGFRKGDKEYEQMNMLKDSMLATFGEGQGSSATPQEPSTPMDKYKQEAETRRTEQFNQIPADYIDKARKAYQKKPSERTPEEQEMVARTRDAKQRSQDSKKQQDDEERKRKIKERQAMRYPAFNR